MIKLKNISKSYTTNLESIKIIDNLSIEFQKERIYSIMGKSGSGKTTLLSIIGGLLRPDEGKIDINSTDNVNSVDFKKISFVFQNPRLLDEYNIIENIMLPLLINNNSYSDSYEAANQLLYKMDLDELKKRYPNQLSRGEQQRISLLRSLSNNPRIILADEPTASLDEKNCEQLLNFIVKINKEFKILFIISTHDKKFMNISDNSYKLIKGKLV